MTDLRRAFTHPLVWLAAGMVLANDFVLRGHAPAWLTDRLSDVGWLVLVPVLLAPLLAWTGRPRMFALVAAAAFYTALQLWSPLGRWFKADHVADPADLFALPALLGAVWVWRRPASVRLPLVLGAALAVGTLAADSWATPPDASWPCAESEEWDPATPLRLQLNGFEFNVPSDTDAFVRGLSLREEGGAEVPFVVANLGGVEVALCARDGLRGGTEYTWTIGPWSADGGNEVEYEHEALPTVHFRTQAGEGVPVAGVQDCAALADQLPDAVYVACDPWAEDTGDSG